MPPKASVILRFVNKSNHRVHNLMTLIRHISHNPNVEIIVSCMENDVTYPADILKLKASIRGRARLIHNFDKRPFASTTANNIGASIAKSNVLIFQDADIIFSISAYNTIIKKITKDGFEAVRVGEDCLNLSQQNTTKLHQEYQKKFSVSPAVHFFNVKKQMGKKGSRDAPGACTALSKKAFTKIGGWCELFQVYGWEDCYFRFKVSKTLNKTCLGMPMIHLAHEINYQARHQPDNAHLHGALVSANPKEYMSIIKRDQAALKEKYPRLFL